MQGKGLQILSGERQAAVQEHITAVKSTRLAVQAENVEQEQRVCTGEYTYMLPILNSALLGRLLLAESV